MKLAILDDWFDTLRRLPCFEILNGVDVTVFNDHVEDVDALAERLQPFDAVVLFRERTDITHELIEKLPNLKLISQRSQYPHIDVDACSEHGVLLCSNTHKGGTPSYAAAELSFGLILASMRQIPQQMASLRMGQWQMGVGKTLRGRTLGLYGYGRIAKAVEEYALAFGMNVLWWASEDGQSRAKADGKSVAKSRSEFFATPDVVSLHLRLNDATRGIVTAKDFANMRDDALFVNTSRAGLLEQGALLDALNAGRPAAAALDVFDVEPITWAEDPLATHPRVTGTPHIGFVTEDEYQHQFTDIFNQVIAWRDGDPIHMVNPDVWQAQNG